VDWGQILTTIIPLVTFVIGVLVALRARKKNAPRKVADLLHHLQDIGVQASRIEKSMYAKIRTAYFLPSPDLLKAIDIIAQHMKSWR
jgi:hypothetical protein